LHEIFFIYFKWFGQTNNLCGLVINVLEYFRFRVEFVQTFNFSCTPLHSGIQYLQILSAYSGYTQTDSHRVFSKNEQIHSSYPANMHSENRWEVYLILHTLRICTDSICIFSVYEQIHSHILCIRTDSFRVCGECAEIISNVRN
jgi:hypothetical protein